MVEVAAFVIIVAAVLWLLPLIADILLISFVYLWDAVLRALPVIVLGGALILLVALANQVTS